LNDIDEIKKLVEAAESEEEAEEKVEEWLDNLPDHLYIYYNIIIEWLWNVNWQRYTTALRDTRKASLR